MHVPSRLVSYLLLSILLLTDAVVGANAQGDQRNVVEPSYDVILQILIGGDAKVAGQALPQGLSTVAKQLRGNYSFADYRLANTYVGRIANGGNFEFKSISNLFGRSGDGETPSFLDWSLAGLRVGPNSAGKSDLMLQGFRFGARVPVRTGIREEAGKQLPIFNYESIGLSSMRITLPENTPTLLGSLSLPNTDNAMFVVITFRPS